MISSHRPFDFREKLDCHLFGNDQDIIMPLIGSWDCRLSMTTPTLQPRLPKFHHRYSRQHYIITITSCTVKSEWKTSSTAVLTLPLQHTPLIARIQYTYLYIYILYGNGFNEMSLGVQFVRFLRFDNRVILQ